MRNNLLLMSAAALVLALPGLASAGDKGGKGHSAHSQKMGKADKHAAKHGAHRGSAKSARADRNDDRRYSARNMSARNCPAGLAKKNNGCMAPGLAKKRYAQGDRLPAAYRTNNVPSAYADRFRDTEQSLYRYSSGQVYRVDRDTRRIAEVIKLAGL